MKNLFRFKAIETVYNGYRMRSRLEARHAVFFDALGIKYEYEREGYDLGGIWYLPDFWLPDHDCFVEIKGEAPTEDELNKARLLAICTQKMVYIFHGDIAPPVLFEPGRLNSFMFRPARVWTYPKSERLGEPSTRRVDVPPYLLMLLQELKNHHIDLSVHPFGDLIVTPECTPYDIGCIDDFLERMQDQQKALQDAQSILEEREEEIKRFLTPEDGWEIEFLRQYRGLEDDCLWGQCNTCGTHCLVTPYFGTHQCNDTTKSDLSFNTPRLLEAYTAARQARFEHKRSRSEARS